MREAVSGYPVGGNAELPASSPTEKLPIQETANHNFCDWAQKREVIAAHKIRSLGGHVGGDADIPPILGIFGDDDVALLDAETLNLARRRCSVHEVYTFANFIVLVDVHVI